MTCRCGYVTSPDLPPPNVPPTVVQRGLNYIKAWSRWNFFGRPVRDDSRVEEIRAICQSCPEGLFVDGVCTHAQCGCSVKEPTWFGDKVKWETEHCPIGQW